MIRLGDERLLYSVLSMLVAAVAWFYVATAQNPLVERMMVVDLHTKGLSTNEVMVQAPPARVQVHVQGPRSALLLVSPALLDASVDLTGLGPGEHRVPVVVAAPPDVRAAVQSPTEVLIVLDLLTSRRFPVEVSLLGAPPQGVTLGSPQVTPPRVTVSGGQSQVVEVRHAVVSVDTTTLHQQLLTSLPVRLVDANGQEVHGVAVDPSIVEAQVPVREGVITKVVPVVPAITGTVPPSLAIVAVEAQPATVALTGPGPLLQGITTVATAPVDLKDARGTFTRPVGLQLPTGVSAPTRSATVTVRMGQATLSTILHGVPVRVVGVSAGTRPRIVPDRVDVQIEGPSGIVEHLNPAAIRVEVDASRAGTGEHRLAARAVLPPGVRLIAIRPSEVRVILTSS